MNTKEVKRTWEWHDFKDINNSLDLQGYFEDREYTHGNYFHYTSLPTINRILQSGGFWLSPISKVNDMEDRKNNNGYKYTLCFATGLNEIIPMWYLYSGIDGCGGCIKFNKNTFRDITEHAVYSLIDFNTKQEIKKLAIGTMIDIKIQDILYYRKEEEKISLKYNTMTNYHFTMEEFVKFKEANSDFIKPLGWYYEKETRIIGELTAEGKRGLGNEDSYRIHMQIPPQYMSKASIITAPKITDKERILNEYSAIKAQDEKNKVSLSTYKGEIDFKLCPAESQEKCAKCKLRQETK